MSPPHILAVDDDANTRELIALYLEKEGYQVSVAVDGEEALLLHARLHPDLMLLDIMLPEMDGWEVCRQIRAHHQTPIIMLSARDEDYDKILGLELGADDYITKPFNPREMVARVKAVLRRTELRASEETERVRVPGLEVNHRDRRVHNHQGEIALTAKEFDILWLLIRSPGRVFTREAILRQVWGHDDWVDIRTIDTHIKRLRQKLGALPDAGWEIRTVWGVGYRFEVKADDE